MAAHLPSMRHIYLAYKMFSELAWNASPRGILPYMNTWHCGRLACTRNCRQYVDTFGHRSIVLLVSSLKVTQWRSLNYFHLTVVFQLTFRTAFAGTCFGWNIGQQKGRIKNNSPLREDSRPTYLNRVALHALAFVRHRRTINMVQAFVASELASTADKHSVS